MMKLSRNQFLADIGKRFNDDVYVNPFSLEMLAWNWIAMALQGTLFLILTFVVEIWPVNILCNKR